MDYDLFSGHSPLTFGVFFFLKDLWCIDNTINYVIDVVPKFMYC